MINESIAKLVKYGENAGLVSGLDKIYATNRILEVMQISDYEEPEQIPETPDLEETLNELLDDAAKRGLLEHNSVVYRDLFDTKLMDCLMPRPGEVVKKFEELYAKSPQEATDYFYKLSQDSNYIRRYRIAKDIRWSVPSAYGDIDISINLSKPEKDPKAIAAAKLAKQSGYPKCLLCKENVGYAGRVNHPARQNHRIIPLTINQTECETALAEIQKVKDIKSLGELTEEEFEAVKDAIKDPVRQKRAKHAVYENQRTVQAVAALKANDIAKFGELMNASHVSLRDDYEVTGIELDTLVEEAWNCPGVIGSRMTGAGFGGCTVSIVKTEDIDNFIAKVGAAYKEKIGYAADFYVVDIGDGAGVLK